MANGLLVLSDWNLARLLYSKARQGGNSKAEALIVYREATQELEIPNIVVLVFKAKELFSPYNNLQA